MPNWCEGNIRFRGTYKNVVKLLSENLVTCEMVTFDEYKELPPIVEQHDGCTDIRAAISGRGFWVKGTHRNFIEDSCIELWDETDSDDEERVWLIDSFKAAWSFTNDKSDEAYTEMAKKYGVDIKLYGVECGIQFAQEVAYYRNGTKEEEVYEYADWDWEAQFPNIGG